MTRRPGTVPLSDLRHYQIRPHQSPARVAERGDFYIRDGWLRPNLAHGGGPAECCYLIDFTAGDDDRSVQLVLSWSPLREKIIEVVLRGGSPVGPCRLIGKPFDASFNLWCFVGVEEDGGLYDPLNALDGPDQTLPAAATL